MKVELHALTADLARLMTDAECLIFDIGILWPRLPKDARRLAEFQMRLSATPEVVLSDDDQLQLEQASVSWQKSLNRSSDPQCIRWEADLLVKPDLVEVIRTFRRRLDAIISRYSSFAYYFRTATTSPTCHHDQAINWLGEIAKPIRYCEDKAGQSLDSVGIYESLLEEWKVGDGPWRTIADMTNPLGEIWRASLDTELVKAIDGPVLNSSAARPKPNGPHEPNQFWWNDKRCELTPLPFKLAQKMWTAILDDPPRIHGDFVLEAVFGSKLDKQTIESLRNHITRANNAFEAVACPHRLARMAPWVVWDRGDDLSEVTSGVTET